MHRLPLAISLLACGAVAQAPIACFDFASQSISSTQPAFASVSDVSVSNNYVFGGGSAGWLCLTTAWNNSGGTITFTVTPNAGESVDYSQLSWSAVTNNPSSSDSIAAVDVFANGSLVGTVDPVTHNTVHEIDLTGFAALQGQAAPVTFVLDLTGNPTGQSSYEIDFLKVSGSRCVLDVNGVQPATLPVVTRDCFTLTGECLDQVTQFTWNGQPLAACTPANFGQGCYEILGAAELKVCPPLCEGAGQYVISLARANGETATANVDLFLPVDGALACPETHPAGTDMCVVVSSGQNPPPNAIFIILSNSNVPSVIPGFINMGLGNMLQEYACGPAYISECVEECYAIPAALAGQTWYFQAIVWNPFQTVLPLPVTNLCETTFY